MVLIDAFLPAFIPFVVSRISIVPIELSMLLAPECTYILLICDLLLVLPLLNEIAWLRRSVAKSVATAAPWQPFDPLVRLSSYLHSVDSVYTNFVAYNDVIHHFWYNGGWNWRNLYALSCHLCQIYLFLYQYNRILYIYYIDRVGGSYN